MIDWLRCRLTQVPIGLAVRFTLFIAVLLLGLTASFVIINNNEAERAANAAFEQSAANVLAVVGGIATDLPAERRLPDLQRVLDRVAAMNIHTRYAYVAALDENRALRTADPDSVRSDPIASMALLDALSGTGPAARRGEGILHIVAPVTSGDRMIGVARVGLSTANVEAAISSAVSRNLLLAIGFITLALPASALFISYLTAPIRRLTQATKRLTAGDFSVSLPEERGDELGDLSRSFVAMTRSLVDSFEAVQRLTLTDRASGLANREQMRRCVQAVLERDQTAALLYLDIDRLKRVNEALGMDVGDDAIVAIAERLTALAVEQREIWAREAPDLEREILVARLGGDEFGIVLSGVVSEETAGQLAARLLGAFARPFDVAGHTVAVGGSIGIALTPSDGHDFSSLLRGAASGLAEAKNAGRGTFKFARRDVNSYAYRRLVIEQELRLALQRDELEVFYQPQVALTDGAIVGAEALVRWRHPTRGLVSPADFIDIAEEVGLLDQIGTYVLREACRQASVWETRGMTPKIAVNVSASQCQRPDFAVSVLDILAEAGVPPRQLEIEITETVAMLDPRTTAREIAPLRAAGVRLAVDDFGTGYSNLASLTRMPFDVLKIDRSFVSECVRDGSARVVVATILTMTQNLGFETVAEGVETAAQREFLLSQGCTFAQGYLFGKPTPADEFERLYLAKRRADARELIGQVRSKAAGGSGRPAA